MAPPVGSRSAEDRAADLCLRRTGLVIYAALVVIGLLAVAQVHPFAIEGLGGRVVVFSTIAMSVFVLAQSRLIG